MENRFRWHWRNYRTASGRDVVLEYVRSRKIDEQRAILAAMNEVRLEGLRIARHMRGDLYEIRAQTGRAHFRIMFSQESRAVMLALHIIDKDSAKTPHADVELAERRLKDWRLRGEGRS